MEPCCTAGYVLSGLQVGYSYIWILGIAHRSMKEDVYRGYYIPEGTFRIWLSC